ncbi:ferredoxin [Nocardioides panacihumi]|uniref:Ferredoxin n=1 Tax=Nocardioides panacihumi TaxID=400774 RepID=A0ABN2QAD7_9ACTN
MKFAIDLTQCENHGQCAIVAPGTFSLDGDGLLSFRAHADDEYVSPELDASDAGQAAEAADMCPMQAIRLIG